MSTLYEATAANAYFWQRLAVRASTRMEAYYLFEAFLGSKPNQDSEQYEYESGQAIADVVNEPAGRARYIYSIDYVELGSPSDMNGYKIGSAVKVVDSGRNG